jgi:hypothetical protein
LIDNREDGRVAADSERKREEDRQREAGTAAQSADAEPDVAENAVHRFRDAGRHRGPPHSGVRGTPT